MRLRHFLALLALLTAGGAIATAQTGPDNGRIGPSNRVQPSGRQLNPVGKMTPLGNHPGGGALTTNGRFLWTLSAGRGLNDIRIVEVEPNVRCAAGRRGDACRRSAARRVGRVVQTIPMPGVNGGIVMAPDGRTAYVSGTPESGHGDQKTPADVPGKQGDVIHVFRYDPNRGTATRNGVIAVPPPSDAPAVQTFPPAPTTRLSWPRDLAVSPDGKTLLAALNLADRAAIIDTGSRRVRYLEVGKYPYGAGISRDGKRGFVSNETDGTVSVIDLAAARKIRDIQVGPHLSHPEGIAMDPKRNRAYVAVTHQDLIAVIDTDQLEVERTLSVGRPEGQGTGPVHLSVTRDGCKLLSANSGEDAVAVFALSTARACDQANLAQRPAQRRRPRRPSRRRAPARRRQPAFTGSAGAFSASQADRLLQAEGRRGADLAENEEEETAELYGEEAEERAEAAKRSRPVARRSQVFGLLGRIPVASYPVMADATPSRKSIVWIAAKGIGVGRNNVAPGDPPVENDPGSATGGSDAVYRFRYLPRNVFGRSGILAFPSDRQLRDLTPKASRQIRPVNGQRPPPGTPIVGPPNQKIQHVFYIVRENRTYDQILGDDPRGDGDPKLTLFDSKTTPNAHALARRFPLLDHVYANSEASIDGHFWTSAAAVSDYVVKNWHQNYADRKRPYDFGVYAVTWPSQRFLFDRAECQGPANYPGCKPISYFNYGEAIAGVVPLTDKDRTPEETQEVARKLAKSDLGPPQGCFSNDASSGGTDVVVSAGPGPDVEVYDSSLPPGARPGSLSRFDCFRTRFNAQVLAGQVPAFNYITLPNDHTNGTTPGSRTPQAMVAENDYALGQFVDLISKSPIWNRSLILVIEDDSQDGADHVDAHRIPAFAISPYAKRGAVVHTRYDFLSFIRTLEIVLGMKPLNLFDNLAVPLYDAFGPNPDNAEPYDAILPQQNLTERNTASSPNARLSQRVMIGTDRTPQRILDRILWQAVHGPGSEPPPPGPNAAGIDEAEWLRRGLPATEEEAREEEGEEEREEEEGER